MSVWFAWTGHSGSITISDFYSGNPERANVGSAWACRAIGYVGGRGMAREGKLPVLGSYATFSAARNLDQIRTSVCYANLNVLIAGAHAGVSVGADGATHQALEDLFAMQGLPNMSVVVLATSWRPQGHELPAARTCGTKYIRFAREASHRYG